MNGFGISFVTISSILATFLYIHAVITGSCPFYDRIEMLCVEIGTLTALVSLAAAIGGTGNLVKLPPLLPGVCPVLRLVLWSAYTILAHTGQANFKTARRIGSMNADLIPKPA